MAQLQLPKKVQTVSIKVGKGSIEVEQLTLDKCKVDVIVGNCANEDVRSAFLDYAGCEIHSTLNITMDENPTSTIFVTPPGDLHSRAIFFAQWLPTEVESILEASTTDFIWSIFQRMIEYNYTTVAFSTVGFEHFSCPMKVLLKTLVRQMKIQLIRIDRQFNIKFITEPNQMEIYNEIGKQILTIDDGVLNEALPLTWEKINGNEKRFAVSRDSDEYKSIKSTFDQAMGNQYREMIKIERIQNERWYRQYLAHRQDFQKRLNSDTEKRLYHGCPSTAVESIVEGGFNRSYAGVNGIAIGAGVYFSTQATYSHTFAKPNARGEHSMFIARVLVGKSTQGNSSMKILPPGFDSTTSSHMFAIFHDAQCYAEYLLTYK